MIEIIRSYNNLYDYAIICGVYVIFYYYTYDIEDDY